MNTKNIKSLLNFKRDISIRKYYIYDIVYNSNKDHGLTIENILRSSSISKLIKNYLEIISILLAPSIKKFLNYLKIFYKSF